MVGRKVVCINNGECVGASSEYVNLTIGHSYLVYQQISDNYRTAYQIVNDLGEKNYYNLNRFINLDDHRLNQIDKVL